MRVKITNTFHGSEITTKVEKNMESYANNGEYMQTLSCYGSEHGSPLKPKLSRIHNKLCSCKGCMCGGHVVEELTK